MRLSCVNWALNIWVSAEKMPKRILFIILGLALTGSLVMAEVKVFSIEEVADGVYLHQGVHVEFDHPQQDDIANIGFIIGAQCIAVIDTGGSVAIGAKLLTAIRKQSSLPICYVINTHVHFDHVLGNFAFVDETPEFIGHTELAAAIAGSRDFFLRQFTANLDAEPSARSIIGPNKVVATTEALDLGDRIIRLTAHQTAHSHNDLTVLDLKTQTLWAGDLVFRERIPALTGSLKGWLAVLKEMEKKQVKLIIPGHGTPSGEWPQALAKQQRYLHLLLNDTRQAIKAGQLMETAMTEIGQDEKLNWLLYDQHHKANIIKAFTELEWE